MSNELIEMKDTEITMSEFGFLIEDGYRGFIDGYNFDYFDMPSELLDRLEKWAEVPSSIEDYNKVGLELAKEVKPYVEHRGKLLFKPIISIEELPEGGRKIICDSVEV